MSKVFICAAIPDELATREEGAVAVATAIEAGDERRARAKFHWQFLEHYPAAQDCAYKFIVCEDKPGIFQVYGKWMSENNNAQVALLNTQLSEFAPTMPHNEAMKN